MALRLPRCNLDTSSVLRRTEEITGKNGFIPLLMRLSMKLMEIVFVAENQQNIEYLCDFIYILYDFIVAKRFMLR